MIRITPPTNYAEWIKVLDILKSRSNDEEALAAMQQGTIVWQSGVAERFSVKLIDVLNSRMNAATDKFQKDIQRANGQERVIVQALFLLRKELRFLLAVTELPAIPEKDRPKYSQLIKSEANRIQSSLETSAKSDRTGKLASIIRGNKVNVF